METRDEKGRFLKGNLFSLGHGMGRPPIYDDAMVMFDKIAEYIEWEDKQKGKPGKGLYTLEGAALYLGFSSVQSMYDYEKRTPDFSYVINKYRLFLVDWNVKKLYWGGTTYGATFWLKNKSDYKDEVTQHQIQTITKVEPQVISSGIPRADNESDVKI
jgi:hypothetical protein